MNVYQKTSYTEKEVFVPLQNLLNKTVERLCESLALGWNEDSLLNLQFSGTVGCDSSAGHVNAHQKYCDPENDSISPMQSLFISNLLIISIHSLSGQEEWINPTPQSYRFCRTLRICSEKEDNANVTREINRMINEIKNLKQHHLYYLMVKKQK